MKKSIMLNIQLHNYDSGSEPAPKFATETEITFAEQLRRQIEERYVGRQSIHEGGGVRLEDLDS
jgi:hypothetical protein